ncbi:sensor histidine kinase, partial [Saccharothrix algeriensis]
PLTAAVASAAVAVAGTAALLHWSGGLVPVAAFCSAAHRRARPWPVLALSVGWQAAAKLLTAKPVAAATFTDLLLLGAAPVAVGCALRLHRERAEHAEFRYRAETGRAVAERHARVAREVHDAVGHHLTAIRLQATAVRRVAADLPPAADHALATIADSSAAALREVRAVLDVLREDRTASLADVADLAARATTPVTFTRDGLTGPLPPLVDHAGYRVVQEALTNALKHSGASRIDVHVHRDRSGLTITVADDGAAAPVAEAGEGAGLRGMRERVRLLGGTLRVTAREPRGLLVEARLPVGSRP